MLELSRTKSEALLKFLFVTFVALTWDRNVVKGLTSKPIDLIPFKAAVSVTVPLPLNGSNIVSLSVILLSLIALFTSAGEFTKEITNESVTTGYVKNLGYKLFTEYLFPFEYIALLLLVAVMGALLLGKKKAFLERDITQKSLKWLKQFH